MATTTTLRNYVSLSDAQTDVSDATLNRLKTAEEAIDAYVGYQVKAVENVFRGQVSSYNASTKTIVDTNNNSMLHVRNGYFTNCVIEIIGGTGAGQIGYITNSSYADYSLTVADAFTTPLDTTSVFRVYQLGKFPRNIDQITSTDGLNYYKSIPQAVKQAVIAQLEFISQKGDAWFQTDVSDIKSENIGNYSYSKDTQGQDVRVTMLSPKARNLLTGIKNNTGTMTSESINESSEVDIHNLPNVGI